MSVGPLVVFGGRIAVVNRTQSLVLAFFAVLWISLVAILFVEPGVYDSAMKLSAGRHRVADLAFLGAITALIAVLAVGVLRHWRWTFWPVQFAKGLLKLADYRRAGLWGLPGTPP